MQSKDKELFTKSMLDCFSIYREQPNPKTIDLYFRLLENYDINSVLKGLESVLRTSKFFPKPSEIIEQIDGNEDEHIDAAYQDIKGIIYHGFHRSIIHRNPITMRVVADMGGQERFYHAAFVDKHDDTAAYFEFKRLYKIYYRRYRETGELPDIKSLKGYMDELPNALPGPAVCPVGLALPVGQTTLVLVGPNG